MCLNIKICKYECSNSTNLSHFQPLEVACRGILISDIIIFYYIESGGLPGDLGDIYVSLSANTRHWSNVVSMLNHRLKCWPNIETTSVKHLLFAVF